MSWNYRVMKHTRIADKELKNPNTGEISQQVGDVEQWYAIHEVYYDDNDKPNGWTKDAVFPIGETPEELLNIYQKLIIPAFSKPVLDYPHE